MWLSSLGERHAPWWLSLGVLGSLLAWLSLGGRTIGRRGAMATFGGTEALPLP